MILHIYFLCSLIFTLITMILKLFLDWLSLIKFSWNVTLHSQKLQGYLITIWTDSICIFRLPCVVALYWHWAQKYLTFFWAASMWVFRSSIVVCFCSQLLQMNCFYMSLQTSLAWCFIFTLITETFDFLMDWFNVSLYIFHCCLFLFTLITNELFLYVSLNLPGLVLYIHIDNRDIWLSYGLIQYDSLDFHLL